DDRTVSDDILGDAFAGLFATDYSSNTRRNSPAMNPAGRVAHGRQHAAIHDGFQRWRHGIDTTDDDAGLSARLHDVGGSQCHVVVVEEGGFDVGILGQMPPMKMLSGASIVCTLIVSSGAISVSRSIT